MVKGRLIRPLEGFWDTVHKVLSKYEVLFIADEVVCEFVRIDSPFG